MPTDRPIGEIGIDSLTAAQLSVEVEERTGANIPLERFLGDESLDDLVREMTGGPASAGNAATAGGPASAGGSGAPEAGA
ncbi:acyl carrier protein [Saccharothrix sp. ST-888]|uniref:acyl carrier protein n=1 Tax=Saccharothrix sp. ST-888 TaxID=1427391 RepID=UPI003FA721C4